SWCTFPTCLLSLGTQTACLMFASMTHRDDNHRPTVETAIAMLSAPAPRRFWRRAGFVTLMIAGVAAGVALSRAALWNVQLKRFAVVREGILYRSAQPSERGFSVLINRYGARTIACLRRENTPV